MRELVTSSVPCADGVTVLVRPSVLATRLVLTACDRSDAAAAAAWFHLDQQVVRLLRTGDEVHVVRTRRGGLGLSIIRDEDLVLAVGAVSAVPLGRNLQVTVRRDRLTRPIQFIDSKRPGRSRATYPWLHPIEFTTRDRVPRKPQGYVMGVWYGAWPPPQDADECVSITRDGICPKPSADVSAHLLALSDGLGIEDWPKMP